MKRTTVNNKVYSLKGVLSNSQFNLLGYLFCFSVRVAFQVRFETLGNATFELENSKIFCLD